MSEFDPNDASVAAIRTPPHSIEAEQSVLGGLLLDNSSWEKIADLLTEGDFYRHDHRLIFKHIAKLVDIARPADVVTVSESLDKSAELASIGGIAYLASLAQNTPSAANIRRYGEIVRERAVMRALAKVGTEIADSAYNPQGRDAAQLLDEAEGKVFQIAESTAKSKQGFLEMPSLLKEVVERIDMLYSRENPDEVTGVPTGFHDLDAKTSGLQPGDLIIVAGRPSMGKAQPLDAQIKTLDGWKRMGELRLGDALASVDGGESHVTGVFPQGERQVYRIRFSDGRSTECCDEHLWRVHYRGWPVPRVLTLAEIRELLTRQRYQRRLWIEMPSGDFGHGEEVPIDAWVLGALLGDGSLTGTAVRFSVKEEETRLRMQSRVDAALELEYAGQYDWRIKRRSATDVVRPTCNPLKQALEELALWGCVSYDKFIPMRYLNASRAVRLDLLRGLLDTDGWVESWGSVRYSTASPQLARDVCTLVRSLGGWCAVSEKQTSYTRDGERQAGAVAYVCTISHPDPQSLFLLSRKRMRLDGGRMRRKMPVIMEIAPSRIAATQCISVSHPSRQYLADHYVLTHNTAFSMNIAEHVAVEAHLPVAVFSMEMGGTQLVMRMLGSVGRLDQHVLRTGKLGDEDWQKLTFAIGKLSEAPMYIDETPALTALELRARARRLARQHGGKLGLIVIDYLQLMSGSGRNDNRTAELGEISRGLKGLAKELQVPVIALSQLSRAVEQRTDKRPMMSDLRESGAIEQDADLIIFMYRDEYYNPDSPDKGLAEAIIGKHRNGPVGRVRLAFIGHYAKFDNAAVHGVSGWADAEG